MQSDPHRPRGLRNENSFVGDMYLFIYIFFFFILGNHMTSLCQVLVSLRSAKLTVKPSKYMFIYRVSGVLPQVYTKLLDHCFSS